MKEKFNRIKTPLQQLIFSYIQYQNILKIVMKNKKLQNKLKIDV